MPAPRLTHASGIFLFSRKSVSCNESVRTACLVVSAIAPLGIIGVPPRLWVVDLPLGLVARRGVVALTCTTMRNTVIPDRPDSPGRGGQPQSLRGGHRVDRAALSAHRGDRGRGHPGIHSAADRSFLGADGICHDGRVTGGGDTPRIVRAGALRSGFQAGTAELTWVPQGGSGPIRTQGAGPR
jgi:hypothetical protein